MSTTFWDLCPDLILEICSYFSIDELYFSFYPNVLPHLFELLTASHMQLHIGLTNDNLLTSMLLSLININKITSLRLSSCDVPLNIFDTVQTLILHDVVNVNSVISKPFTLPSLQRLILIYSCHQSYSIESVLRVAFARPSLKYLKLQSKNNCLSALSIPLERSFSIKQLVLNASFSYVILNLLLNSLPNLRILRIRTLVDTQPTVVRNSVGVNNVVAPPIIHHPSLQTLDLVWYHPTMTYITALLRGLSNLKQCRLSGVMNFQELNGQFWHHLITQICQHLLRINVNMLIWTGIKTEEIKTKFDQDMFFKRINFELIPSDKEKELCILFRDFRRFV